MKNIFKILKPTIPRSFTEKAAAFAEKAAAFKTKLAGSTSKAAAVTGPDKPLLSEALATLDAEDLAEFKALAAECPTLTFTEFADMAESARPLAARAAARPTRSASADSSQPTKFTSEDSTALAVLASAAYKSDVDSHPGETFKDYCARRQVKPSMESMAQFNGGIPGGVAFRASMGCATPPAITNPLIAAEKRHYEAGAVEPRPRGELPAKEKAEEPRLTIYLPAGAR